MVGKRLAAFGECPIVDMHSFPAQPLPYESDQTALRPDICIGTDSFHTPAALAAYTHDYFASAGLRVAFNTPFAGTITPLPYYRQSRQVISIMLEVNRALYMQENSFAKAPGSVRVQALLRRYLSSLETRCFF